MRKITLIASSVIALVTLAFWAPMLGAYETYSQVKFTNPDGIEVPVGNCQTCHGDYRNEDYISLTDGKLWSVIYLEVEEDPPPVEERGLHDIHRHVMVDKIGRSRCNVCHTRPPGFYPVILDSSTSEDWEQLGCTGCHGRAQDGGNDNISGGLGAGLRQHHTNAGITACKDCHADADPARYTPVGEDVLPPYYFSPDDVFPNKPTDPCSKHGEEDYAGKPKGLDNDGDGKYDMSDNDCPPGQQKK